MISLEEQQALYLRMACRAAHRSPDMSTKNGACLVCKDTGSNTGRWVTCGFNGYIEGQAGLIDYAIQENRDIKHAVTEHAERQVIFHAAMDAAEFTGHPGTVGSVLYCPFAACTDCARAIVRFGVAELVRLPAETFDGFPERWRASIELADRILAHGGVKVTSYNGPKIEQTFFLDGKTWNV